jgi:hypothetical protein
LILELLIRGYDPYDCGRELIPRVREGVAQRDRDAARRAVAA